MHFEKNNNRKEKSRIAATYNVLWFDDRISSQEEFMTEAKDNGIILHGFSTLDEGMEELEDKLSFFDAVLLDTTFFIDSEDESSKGVSDSLRALSLAVNRINQLSAKKILPYFIFSSNTAYETDTTFIATYETYYRKYVKEDIIRLFADIRNEVCSRTDAVIRNKYREVFEAFTPSYIGTNHINALFEILRNIENPTKSINERVYYNPLRKILEAIFVALRRVGTIHKDCFKEEGEPNLLFCSLYLSGKEIRFKGGRYLKPRTTILPTIIQNNVWNIINYTNIGSHNEVPGKREGSEISQLRASGVDSPYLLYILTFELLDVILWAKCHIERTIPSQKEATPIISTHVTI